MKNKHNGVISFWKFVFCLVIIALHFFAAVKLDVPISFKGGSIGVEFFFIVSGYLLASKAARTKLQDNRNIGKETIKFMLQRIKKMYPLIFLILLISLVFYVITRTYRINNIINFIWDFLLFRNLGIKYSTIMYVGWYVSVLLLCSLLIYPLLLKHRTNYSLLIAPIIVLFVGAYIAHTWGTLCWDGEYYLKCFLRGFFEMNLGVFSYECSKKINSINLTKLSKWLLTIVEILGFVFVILLTNLNNFHNDYDFVSLLILFVCVTIAFSEKTCFVNHFSNKFIYYLEKLSFPMFLSQGLIIDAMAILYKNINIPAYTQLLLVLFVDLIFSIVCLKIVDFYNLNRIRIRKIFIRG